MTERQSGRRVAALVTVALVIAAAVAMLFGISKATSSADSEILESPLALAIFHELKAGPWELYGPFDASNPWVLIHAPFYYRAAGAIAWLFTRFAVDPVMAAIMAGRLISFLGLGATLAAAFQFARLDGAPRIAGVWAVLFIASSPVVGVLPYTVRPDMLGIALHTWGILLVVSALQSQRPSPGLLPLAYAIFGFAAATKQHLIVGPIVSALLLVTAWARGRMSPRGLGAGFVTGILTLLTIYGVEELGSGGRMSQAVFQVAASSSLVHPVGWARASIVVYGIVGKSGGIIIVLLAAGIASLIAVPPIIRAILTLAGAILLCGFATRVAFEALEIDSTGYDQVITLVTYFITIMVMLPACWILNPRNSPLGLSLDRTIAVYLIFEAALVLFLSRASAGAWINYGIQLVVFASILTGRALARSCERSPGAVRSALIGVAALVLMIGVFVDTRRSIRTSYEDQLSVAAILKQIARPGSEFFFVNRPGLNRQHGLLTLAYDDWLFPVFEAKHLAQPRSIWLRRALTSGEIRFVVTLSDSPKIDGLGPKLTDLGYAPGYKIGTRCYIWKRLDVNPGLLPR